MVASYAGRRVSNSWSIVVVFVRLAPKYGATATPSTYW